MGAQLDIFTGEETPRPESRKGRDEVFNDYEAYLAKFNDLPKTTDDTFTPPDVFAAVLEWLKGKGKITGETRIIRPFYPGGDFESAAYPDGCVVVDNPPFSIFAKCCKWFAARGIPFFLFGPGLTLSSAAGFCTCVVVACAVKFENGAKIPVSFASNMFGGLAAMAAGDLCSMINGCPSQQSDAKTLRKMAWPDGLVTLSTLRTIAAGGGTFELLRECSKEVKSVGGETIFGHAWLSAQAAQAAKAAQAAQAAKAAQAAQAAKGNAVKVELLPSEKAELDRLCRIYDERGEQQANGSQK